MKKKPLSYPLDFSDCFMTVSFLFPGGLFGGTFLGHNVGVCFFFLSAGLPALSHVNFVGSLGHPRRDTRKA